MQARKVTSWNETAFSFANSLMIGMSNTSEHSCKVSTLLKLQCSGHESYANAAAVGYSSQGTQQAASMHAYTDKT